MNVEEPAAAWPARASAPPELAARAMELVREFPGCFWFRHPEATVRYTDDVRLVIRRLREYGDKRAWRKAAELQRCL